MFDSVLMYKVTDLLFASRIEVICNRSSSKFRSIQNLDQLGTALSRSKHSLIVCDLVSTRTDLEPVTRMAKANNSEVIGYYPHVDKDTATLAHSLNVNYVTPRSAFHSKLSTLVLQKSQ